jgi:hypothetical protein
MSPGGAAKAPGSTGVVVGAPGNSALASGGGGQPIDIIVIMGCAITLPGSCGNPAVAGCFLLPLLCLVFIFSTLGVKVEERKLRSKLLASLE